MVLLIYRFKYFLILQCLLGSAWSNYPSYDETYEFLIGSSELIGPPWSDPYNSEDVEDYYDYAAYDDFEKPYISDNDDRYVPRYEAVPLALRMKISMQAMEIGTK